MLPNMKAAQGQKRAGLELRAEQGDAFKCAQSGIAATCCVCVTSWQTGSQSAAIFALSRPAEMCDQSVCLSLLHSPSLSLLICISQLVFDSLPNAYLTLTLVTVAALINPRSGVMRPGRRLSVHCIPPFRYCHNSWP